MSPTSRLSRLRRGCTRLLTSVVLALAVLQPAVADDRDIYNGPKTSAAQAPLTFLALDLNVVQPTEVVCNNVLLSSDANCVEIRSKITVKDLLGLFGLPDTVTNIVGGLNPQALLSDLDSSVRTILGTTLSASVSLSLNQQQIYVVGIKQILESLVNSRVAIILNHSAKGPGASAATPCAYSDLASLPGERQDTVACSNGSYLFAGLVSLADPVQLQALLTKVTTGLTTSTILGVAGVANFADSPFQAKEIYLELAKYLRGDRIYNGHLGYYDYGDNDSTTNLDSSLPLLAWDRNAELAPAYKFYKPALSSFPDACAINLLNVQLTNAANQDESDPQLKVLFPEADANGDTLVTLPELVAAASDPARGFVYTGGQRRAIRSSFLIQDNLSDRTALQNAGNNVSSYTNVLGLLGRGQDLARGVSKPPLVIDTSLSSASVASSRSTATGLTGAAYVSLFHPDMQQKPDWPGNVKKLKLEKVGSRFELRDACGRAAIDPTTGRLNAGAATSWAAVSQSCTSTPVPIDGNSTTLGGAGEKIPGFRAGGGGNPLRTNPADSTGRKLFFDSYTGTRGGALTAIAPDDSAVRSELQRPTGATAYSPSVAAGTLACETAFTSCGLLCSTTKGISDNACALTNGVCSSLCATTATACSLLCLPGSLGNSCRANCTATQTSCGTSCGTGQTNCLTASTNAFNSCSNNCLSVRTDCLAALVANARTADTVTRELLLYARGYDVGPVASPKGNGPLASPTNSGISGRAWLLGGVLHSRPLAINYGPLGGSTSSTEDVRVLVGSADGYLRMLDDATGAELWAFMPQAAMSALPSLRENSPGSQVPYGVDGPVVALIRDRDDPARNDDEYVVSTSRSSSEDRVLAFFGLRRGGNRYYAMDLTNPDAPSGDPCNGGSGAKLLWSIGPDGLRRACSSGVVAGTATQFSALALAFSTPQFGKILYDHDSNSSTPDQARSVLIFGGGYNGGRNGAGQKIGKDYNNSENTTIAQQIGTDDGTGSGSTAVDRGNAIYIVDAETGSLIWRSVRGSETPRYDVSTLSYRHPLMVDGIASDITALDTNNDGLTDRLYVGDTGGRLWRADLAGSRSTWTATPVASVGRHAVTSPTLADDRRFFNAPDLVPVRKRDEAYDLVLFGTGDREDPFNTTTENSFYVFRDTDVISGKSDSEIIVSENDPRLAKHATFSDRSTSCASASSSSSGCTDVRTLNPGYRFKLGRSGEKMFSSPLTLSGAVSFSTYTPSAPSCTPEEGNSRLYNIDLLTSKPLPYLNQVGDDRSSALGTGPAGEVLPVSGSAQLVNNQLFQQPASSYFPASWRERLGEDERPSQ